MLQRMRSRLRWQLRAGQLTWRRRREESQGPPLVPLGCALACITTMRKAHLQRLGSVTGMLEGVDPGPGRDAGVHAHATQKVLRRCPAVCFSVLSASPPHHRDAQTLKQNEAARPQNGKESPWLRLNQGAQPACHTAGSAVGCGWRLKYGRPGNPAGPLLHACDTTLDSICACEKHAVQMHIWGETMPNSPFASCSPAKPDGALVAPPRRHHCGLQSGRRQRCADMGCAVMCTEVATDAFN